MTLIGDHYVLGFDIAVGDRGIQRVKMSQTTSGITKLESVL